MARVKKRSRESKIALAERRIVDVREDFEYLKLLVYGKPKRGKTMFGASGPKPVLILDANDKGTLSVRNYPGTKVFHMNRWSDIDLIYWYLHSGNHKFKTLVLDNVSSLQNLCMKFVLGDDASRDPTKDPTMPSKPTWGRVGELMKTQILQFRDLPMHIVFLAQERRGFSEEDEEVPEVFPDVSPSIRNSLTPAVDIIGRIYVKEVPKKKGDGTGVEYRLLIGAHEIYTTGDRSRAGLPKVVRLKNDDTENLARLVARIKRGQKEEVSGNKA